jgi:hypothetical protein
MVEAISTIVGWIVVPGILVVLFIYALVLMGGAPQGPPRRSATAGFLAGLVLFVVFVVSQLDAIREPSFEFSRFPSLEVIPMGLGLVIGFVLLLVVRWITPTPLVGLLTLLLAAASSSALYTYIFIESLRSTLLFLTLGTALGALLHIVFFPSSVRDLQD